MFALKRFRIFTSPRHQKLALSSFCTTAKPKFNVLFFGTDNIAKLVLEALHKNQLNQFKATIVDRLEVVTSPEVIGSKNISSVKLYCLEKNLNMHQPLTKDKNAVKEEQWKAFFKEFLESEFNRDNKKFTIGIVCSFGYMIPDFIIDCFEKGMLVIHPSLLPKYRGASPIQYTLLNGDPEAGTSIIEISKQAFDKGRILYQEAIPVDSMYRYKELSAELGVLGGNRILDVLENFDYYKLNAKPQESSSYPASKAPKFNAKDTVLHWISETHQQIYNRYRAFFGTNFKTVRTRFNDTWYYIDEMELITIGSDEDRILAEYREAAPGSIWVVGNKKFKNNLYVKCREGWVVVKVGNLSGSGPQPVHKFINQFVDRSKILEDKQSVGHYFFN